MSHPQPGDSVTRNLQRPAPYKQGEHICAFYETAAEQVAVAAEYLADGLRAGERVFYVAESEAALQTFRDALTDLGIDVGEAVTQGALVQSTHADAHLVDGYFDSERMLRMLNDALEQALTDGFAGLRTCGDMTWLLAEPPGAHNVVEYEAMLNRFFFGVRGAGMCQYDVKRLPRRLLEHGLATHTSVVIDRRHRANPFYVVPELAVGRTAQPEHLDRKLSQLRAR